MTSEHSKQVEQALARLKAQQTFAMDAAKLAFRQDRDPLLLFAKQLVLTTVIHAGTVEAIQRVHTTEIQDLITELKNMVADPSIESRVEVFGFWIKSPEQVIRVLIYTLFGSWLLFLAIRKIF